MNDLYHNQRTMRAMRRAAIEHGSVALIDLGSSKVACTLLQLSVGRRPSATGTGSSIDSVRQARIIGASMVPTSGISRGEISNIHEAERAIRAAVKAAQKMAATRTKHAIVCFSGATPTSQDSVGEIALDEYPITEADIAQLLSDCEILDVAPQQDILHAQPVNFSLDHRTGILDPRGQLGRRLMVDLHLVAVDSVAIANILQCLKNCGLEAAGLASSAYVSGVSSLVEDEQELGAACVDLGGETTGISIFLRKHMVHTETIPLGGRDITSDISHALRVNLEQAERIKTFYGGLVTTGMDEREMIEISRDTGDWEHDRCQISRSELIGIIRPRVDEILENVRFRLDKAGFDYMPSQQIVLTGGTSQIPGLDGVARKILGPQVRMGRPFPMKGLPQALTGPAFSGVVGLAQFATNPQDECWDFEMPDNSYGVRTFMGALKWIKNNW